jgi:pimeloyl-ACP methyl ester carboxylesterase
MYRIESLLSARLFLRPELVDDLIFMLSNLSGHNNLYVMRHGGSVPKPLLPPNIALQNPHLIGGMSFAVYKDLDKVVVMIDRDGDENYLPMEIPLSGGFPVSAFNNFFENTRCYLGGVDAKQHRCIIVAESREESMRRTYLCHVDTGEVEEIYASPFGAFPEAINEDYSRMMLVEAYMVGDTVAYLWEKGKDLRLLYGKPIGDREKGESEPLAAFGNGFFTEDGNGLVIRNALFQDTYSLGYLELHNPETVKPVEFRGLAHAGVGEFIGLEELRNGRYLLNFNIDGASWAYEAEYDPQDQAMCAVNLLVGKDVLSDGVLEAIKYNEDKDVFALSFSTATAPTQIFTLEGDDRDRLIMHTDESILGIPEKLLSPGEDCAYYSFDGLRISARLYMPSPELGFTGKRPIVYYLHGGPHGQERPDFSWFSMPLIQYLTSQGFAVFVPNVRGSSGYGLAYTKQVDRDWGGNDRLDHVHAMSEVLPKDDRLDVNRAGVVGRSYGGYMALTLAGRHPEIWAAAVDMFGPYDLVTFLKRIPPTWKPYFYVALGNPDNPEDLAFLKDRSPKSYIDNLQAPMLVIQGRNDPRVVAEESEDLVKHLQAIGKDVEMLLFEDEGHGVEKYINKVTCYNVITDFFKETLKP